MPKFLLATSDPGDLNVAMSVRGLTLNEAKVVLANLPAGTTSSVRVALPQIGGKRYSVDTDDLSSHAAKELVTALCASTARTAADQGQEGF